MQGVFFKSEKELFEFLLNMYWQKDDEDPFGQLKNAIKSRAIPRIGEILWDEFKDRSVWHVDERQVMNIVLMNIEMV